MWKICTKCKKHKALWAFTKSKNNQFSVYCHCKLCHCRTEKQRRVKYPKRVKQSAKKWRDTNKEKINAQWRKRYAEDSAFREDHINSKRNYYKANAKVIMECNNKYREKNRYKVLTYERKARLNNASYKTYKNQLTSEEEPRLSEDGFSLETKCKNCREYFKPCLGAVRDRIKALNELNGTECNLYCSDECKTTCTVFGKRSTTSISLREPIPQELRDEILQRNDGMCEMCGKHPSKEVHHEKPVATHPHLQLDKDNLWGLCKYCHYEVCHQLEGCTLAELRKNSVNTVCNRTN
jgi:hypothetical protein